MVATTDTSAPLFIVIGITVNQGSSVANALIESSKSYRIVGITRDPSKSKAKAFAEKGVILREVDLQPQNLDAVTAAFKDADYLFVSVPESFDLYHLELTVFDSYRPLPILPNFAAYIRKLIKEKCVSVSSVGFLLDPLLTHSITALQ